MDYRKLLRAAALFLEEPRAIGCWLKWPRFSLTSYRMVAALRKQGILPRTVIDVGANGGQFAVAAAKLFPACQVFAYEPGPGAFRRLSAAITQLPQVRAERLAIGDRDGETLLHLNLDDRASSVLQIGARHLESFPAAREDRTISVATRTLDSLWPGIPATGPVLLKIDVQGYEGAVLRGADRSMREIEWVVLETSFRPLYENESTFREILGQMEKAGFVLLRPVDWAADPKTGEILQMDALFVRAS